MTDHDAHVLAWLAEWLRTADLPTAPYRVNRATLVADPGLAHQYLRAAVAADPAPTGQVRRALLARLRTLRRLAAAGWKLEG